MCMIPIAVAGAGDIGLSHIGVNKRSASCALLALVNSSSAAQTHADQLRVPLCKPLAELFASDDLPRPEDRSSRRPFQVGVLGMVRDDPLRHQLEHFGAVIRGEAEPVCGTALPIPVTDANVAAAKSGMTVKLPPG